MKIMNFLRKPAPTDGYLPSFDIEKNKERDLSVEIDFTLYILMNILQARVKNKYCITLNDHYFQHHLQSDCEEFQ